MHDADALHFERQLHIAYLTSNSVFLIHDNTAVLTSNFHPPLSLVGTHFLPIRFIFQVLVILELSISDLAIVE